MRKFLLASILTIAAAPAAFACECPAGMTAASVLADHSYSVADVTVRGMNVNNRQSALQINTVRSGFLTAQNIRASFRTDSCGTIPQYKQNMTLLIRAESDGTYSIGNQCETKAVLSGQ